MRSVEIILTYHTGIVMSRIIQCEGVRHIWWSLLPGDPVHKKLPVYGPPFFSSGKPELIKACSMLLHSENKNFQQELITGGTYVWKVGAAIGLFTKASRREGLMAHVSKTSFKMLDSLGFLAFGVRLLE